MITIETTRLDFRTDNEEFARNLYGRWEDFFRTSVEKVMEDTLAAYDREDEVVRIKSLTVDIGVLAAQDFYEYFPRKFAVKLEELFQDCLKHQARYSVEVISLKEDNLNALMCYLNYGYWPVTSVGGKRSLSDLLKNVIRQNERLFITSLKEAGSSAQLRRRLVFHFTDEDLELVVKAAEPSEADFIIAYTRYLTTIYRDLKRPEITGADYRDVVWLVVFSYLLSEGRSFFDRKQLVEQTIRHLAVHFNLSYRELLFTLSRGLSTYRKQWTFIPDLLKILGELETEDRGESEIAGRTACLKKEGNIITETEKEILVRLLAVGESCRRLLLPLKEEEIIRLVEIIVPAESAFIGDYAKGLEVEKDKGMLEGKAGSEFRLLKWEFIFQVVLAAPFSAFQRQQFAYSVLQRIAAHYNIDVWTLLLFLYVERNGFSSIVAGVLEGLYEQWVAQGQQTLVKMPLKPGEGQREQWIRLLLHPSSARLYLSALPEESIYHLVQVVVPEESGFITTYAERLEQEKKRGMLEGKAGAEFRILKWEFIFSVVLNRTTETFSRKQFVRSVLAHLSAHYNVELVYLLEYFYVGVEKGVTEEWVETIRELWGEEKWRRGADLKSSKQREELFKILENKENMTEAIWLKLGNDFVLQLLEDYQLPGRAEFIRKHKETLGKVLFRQGENMFRLYGLVKSWPGVFRFLESVYGREVLVKVFKEKGSDLSSSEEWRREVVKAVLLEGTPAEQRWLLERSSSIGKEVWAKFSRQEKSLVLLRLKNHPELLECGVLYLGTAPLRQVYWELEQLCRGIAGFPERQVWLGWLSAYLKAESENSSYGEIWQDLWVGYFSKWGGDFCENFKVALEHFYSIKQVIFPEIAGCSPVSSSASEEQRKLCFFIRNAGLVLLTPYFPQLFSALGYVKQGKFIGTEAQARACLVLQKLLLTAEEVTEPDLILNKLLVGLDLKVAIPLRADLTGKEKEWVTSLLKGVKSNWEKMCNTSIEGFCNSFLVRQGKLLEREDCWLLEVERKSYDILLDTLPWSFSHTKYAWMDKVLCVNWM